MGVRAIVEGNFFSPAEKGGRGIFVELPQEEGGAGGGTSHSEVVVTPEVPKYVFLPWPLLLDSGGGNYT